MDTSIFHSIIFNLIVLLYIILSLLGIVLVYLYSQKTASANKVLKKDLAEEKLKLEQARNCTSIMRLLRQWQNSFPAIDQLSNTLQQIQTHLWEEKSQDLVDRQVYTSDFINRHQAIKQLTTSLDIAELILRKIQAVNLDEEDRQILKAEFFHLYTQLCRPMLQKLSLLKKPAPHSKTTPYELLDAAPTIEVLETYFEVLM